MSQSKVFGPLAAAGATAATLPVTGNNVVTTALVGLVMVAAGLLLIRSVAARNPNS
jgi:LPXTG-motif cell wall-anchored protein